MTVEFDETKYENDVKTFQRFHNRYCYADSNLKQDMIWEEFQDWLEEEGYK